MGRALLRLPVSTSITGERLLEALEATAYFIVAEALTNALRHARAGSVEVAAAVERRELWLAVSDDGAGEGTIITARLPLPGK